MGQVIFDSRAPIMKDSQVARRYDEAPVNVEDVILMTWNPRGLEEGVSWRGLSTGRPSRSVDG